MPHTPITVERARASDLPAMVELWGALMRTHKSLDPVFEIREDAFETWAEFIRTSMKKRSAFVIVARDEGQVVGYCLAFIMPHPPVFEASHFGEIMELVVAPSHSRQGVGETILSRVVAWFREHDVSRVEVRAHLRNPVSKAFWRKMNFTPYLEILAADI